MKSLQDVRTSFLDFFKANGHEIIASSSLVPQNDPTLLFTNAGMVQFKNVFTAQEQRAYKRAATVQKCVRAGGKHNDLDNVGYTARHHTFFEMLGNFSFGDYFKEEAIRLAWTLITKEFGLPKDRLWVTVYPTDEEARGLWKKIANLPDERIIGHHENLWAMGPTGPCGYCSEIFFDQGPAVKGGPPGSPDEDGDRYLEFWNLVFMQFEQIDEKTRIDLPRPSIDTGMGLERITAILQGVTDNYDIDLFRELIKASRGLTRGSAGDNHPVSHRVIADHLRSGSFLMADGVMPSNEGRGYVLRRILRRAMRHAHILGTQDPLLYKLVPTLTRLMGDAYPELKRAEPLITDQFLQEETRFRDLLERGLKLLDEATAGMSKGGVLSGDVAFRLYDTYGFPIDLTQDALRERGMTVDEDGFNAAMRAQQDRSRGAWAGSGEQATEAVWFALRQKLGATKFLGYETTNAEGKVLAILNGANEVTSAKAGETVRVITDQTPFYGEGGGQIGDTGGALSAKGFEASVTDTQKELGDLFIHVMKIDHGTLNVGDAIELRVDAVRRDQIRANHSATHLLHEALRRVLGAHVSQKGSLVAPDRLRFDISHGKPMTADEIARVEAIVNAQIRRNTDVSTRVMSPDNAVKAGALALFGEKYGDEVRVLAMGLDADANEREGNYSVELCGGTHVRRLGDIALFKIISESGVAAGVRRIEALTGEAARQYFEDEERALKQTAEVLRVAADLVPERVKQLVDERRRLERELAEAKKALALSGGAGAAPKANRVREVNGFKFLGDVVEGIPPGDLRGLIDAGKKEIGSGVVAFVGINEGKAALAVGVTDDLKARVSAVDLVKSGVAILGGKGGGGRPDMAQGGGPDTDKAGDAIAAIEKQLSAA
ncbi:MAG: alanine--tRNA ligase [Alphaproteobacteria bacterium]